MQSWVRRSNKIKKEKENRKIQWRINIEIINSIMYVIATVTLIILMGTLIFITAYSHNDLVISIMSLLMLVLSLFLSVKKLNPYMAFAVMIFVTIYGIIGVTVVLRGKISPQMSEIVCRWISAVSLVSSIIIEWIQIIRGIIEESKLTIKKYESKKLK